MSTIRLLQWHNKHIAIADWAILLSCRWELQLFIPLRVDSLVYNSAEWLILSLLQLIFSAIVSGVCRCGPCFTNLALQCFWGPFTNKTMRYLSPNPQYLSIHECSNAGNLTFFLLGNSTYYKKCSMHEKPKCSSYSCVCEYQKIVGSSFGCLTLFVNAVLICSLTRNNLGLGTCNR